MSAWFSVAAWYTLGNIVGGVVLVTGLRLVQVGERIGDERAATEKEHASSDDDARTDADT